MAQTGDKASIENELSEVDSDLSSGSLGPSLEFENLRNGYISTEAIQGDKKTFDIPKKSFDYFNSLTDHNILVGAQKSAEIFENYIGQYSFGDEPLDDYLEDMPVKGNELEGLESSFVLDLDLFEYDGRQHVRYSEGEVAEEVVEYLTEDSEWSENLYFLEEEEKLFIRSNP